MTKASWFGLVAGLLALSGCGAAPTETEAEELGSVQQAASHSWSKISNISGPLGSPPAIVRNACGLHVFFRRTDNALGYIQHNGIQWLAAQNLGGILTSAPAASPLFQEQVGQPCSIAVAVRDLNNQVQTKVLHNGAWGAYKLVPGASFPSFGEPNGPALVWGGTVAAPKLYVLFANDAGVIRFAGTSTPVEGVGWSAWTSMANGVIGSVQGLPAATSTLTGQGAFPIRVVARGTDGNMWETPFSALGSTTWSKVGNLGLFDQTGAGLSSWTPPCGGFASATYNLAISSSGTTRVNRKTNGTWSGYTSLISPVGSSPAISSNTCGRYDIAVQFPDGSYWWDRYQ